MPPVQRAESLGSRGFSSGERFTASSNLSLSSIVTGWRRCYCGGREVLVTSQSTRNPGRMFWGCPNWRVMWADENNGGLDGVDQVVTDAVEE
ncbi:hypothetical protein E2542_SST20993 [Spatholobus suberectus]|nr:hypothetical protein E2542_SST20993 [Spatholobus suberectus]